MVKSKRRREKRERLNYGNNNGQATHGARKPPGPKAFDQIDWQRERLSSLARKVNVNFVRENRSVIKKSFLMDKLKFLSYDSIVRLVKLSNGWLKFARKDHIKRNNMTDLNFVCNKILKY